jgi:hypothetical protein
VSIHYLSPSTIETLRKARAERLAAAMNAEIKVKKLHKEARTHSAAVVLASVEAEDLRRILEDADPDNPDYQQPAPVSDGGGAELLAGITAAAALLETAALPLELAEKTPSLTIRFSVGSREEAARILGVIEASPGSWYNHAPGESYHWLQATRYGTPVRLEVTVDYTVPEPVPEPEAEQVSA